MDVYRIMKEQRKNITAPVDQMGCCSFGNFESGETKKFHILVGLLLSSQTKDEVTYDAVQTLCTRLGVLTPQSILNAPESVVHSCIEKVGYHNKKTEFLYKIAAMVKEKMPETLHNTLSLPGIGKKMAYLYLAHACNRNEGIGVDTHVHRISNRIGLVKTNNEEQTRKQLEEILDKKEWQTINQVMVGFGQVICKPIKPKCNSCQAVHICPYKNLKLVSKNIL